MGGREMIDIIFFAILPLFFIAIVIIHNRATRAASKQIEKGFAAYVLIMKTAESIRAYQVSKILNH
jgi:hypothetical protein